MKTLTPALLAVGLLAWGCSLPEDQPSEPAPIPEGPATVSAPNPDPGATPTPTLGSPSSAPTPEPEDSPDDPEGGDPSDDPSGDPLEDPTHEPDHPPPGSGCGDPIPPEISRFNVKVHLRGANSWTLDSTPLVGPDVEYCREIGFKDGRSFCPVRPEGHPERDTCETWAVGTAVDTGRPGPTWRRNGQLCTGASGCENHPDNQYFVRAFSGGTYEACARNGACGTREVAR
jgi:hypothetical protein